MTKKRILFCGEASWLATGFSTYNREVISRLHATGKYEIAEMGSYASTEDERAKQLPWRFYGVLPNNQEEANIYQKSPVNQFGAYKFDAIVADFQPDIVFDPRDPWMFGHIQSSRFRNLYKTVLMPTVDSAPQKKEWVEDIFKKTDAITAYSRYGKRVLEADGVKVADVTSPGVDLEIFKPKDKFEARAEWPLPLGKKPIIIGTVMRNQKRKLFPELFEAFMEMRRRHPNDQIIKRTALLCHTSWPDVGWDIPELIRRTQIQRHVIFTYICDACDEVFLSWILSTGANGKGRCALCGKMEAHMPNTHKMVSDKILARVYQSMDIYIQPAICEGWALPIVEAKACGLPTICHNYSAMEDHVENPGGVELKVGRLYTESETMAVRALPDIEDMIEKMYDLVKNSKKRRKLGEEARKCAEEMHTWSLTAGKLEAIFDELEVHDREETWNRRPEFKITDRTPIPKDLTNDKFVLLCYRRILDRDPDQDGFNHWMKELSKGASKDAVEAFFRGENDTHNKFEQIRWNKSLALRDYPMDNGIVLNTNRLPGIAI